LYFLDNVYFEIISNDDENNCDGNETSYVANKLSYVNDTNDHIIMPEDYGVIIYIKKIP